MLVDIGRLRDLSYVRDGGDHVAVGAPTTHEELHFDELLRSQRAILSPTPGGVASPRRPPRGGCAPRRSATAAPSAAPSPTPTPPPTCRPCCWRWTPRWSCTARAATGRGRRAGSWRG